MPSPSSAIARRALRELPLFSSLAPRELDQLVERCTLRRLAPRREVFSPLQAADRFFVLVKGRVKVFQLSARGDEQILHLFGPGHTFGEAAMWTGGRFPAHAETLEPTILVVIERAALREMIARRPDVALVMLGGLSAKLQEFNRLIEQLSLHRVPARLARVLLELSRTAGADRFRLPQTKRALAAQIGIAPETLSRALGRLRGEGLIEVHGALITIRNRARLARLAAG